MVIVPRYEKECGESEREREREEGGGRGVC